MTSYGKRTVNSEITAIAKKYPYAKRESDSKIVLSNANQLGDKAKVVVIKFDGKYSYKRNHQLIIDNSFKRSTKKELQSLIRRGGDSY